MVVGDDPGRVARSLPRAYTRDRMWPRGRCMDTSSAAWTPKPHTRFRAILRAATVSRSDDGRQAKYVHELE